MFISLDWNSCPFHCGQARRKEHPSTKNAKHTRMFSISATATQCGEDDDDDEMVMMMTRL